MNALWDLFESENVFAFFFLAMLLHWVGQAIAQQNDTDRLWARHIAGVGFWIYVCLHLAADGWDDPILLCGIVIRGLLVTLFLHGLMLTVLASVNVVHRRADGGWRKLVGCVQRWLGRRADAHRAAHERQVERRRQIEWNATAPERERKEAAARELAQEAARRAAETQRRREAMQLDCQLLYDRHAAMLRELLPRERFDALMAISLPNSIDLEVAEQRANQIQQLVHELVAEVSRGRQKFRDLFAIANHFHERRLQLDELPYDQNTKAALKAALTLQEEASIQEFLKS